MLKKGEGRERELGLQNTGGFVNVSSLEISQRGRYSRTSLQFLRRLYARNCNRRETS